MAKSPRIRHSKETGGPVTIELAADAVSESSEAAAGIAPESAEAAPDPIASPPPDPAPDTAASASEPMREQVPPAPQARRGMGALLAAGVIGGALATAGNWGLGFLNPPTSSQPAGPDLAAELAARDGRIAQVADGLSTLRADIDALKNTVAGIAPGQAPDLTAFDGRLAELEKKIANLAIAGGDPVVAEKLSAIDARIADVAATAAAAADAARAASETAGAQAARVDAIAATVKAVEEKAAAAANNPKIALAIAAAALKSAVDRGQPFMTELETYAAVAPQAPEIASLRQFAASGVPTRADLATAAGEAAAGMIAAMKAADPEAGFLQRLIDSAKALVTVRPIGMVEGEGIDAIAARVEARTTAGDLRGALDELAKAPEAAKAAAAGFAGKLEARLSVETLIDAALAAALKSGG